MAKKYQANDRPVPGYQLLKFLGRGGFGQVWAATGPGGVKVAIKIIDMEGGEGLKEFRGIRLLKNIHHPNLAPIIGVWLRDESGDVIEEDPMSMDATESINIRSLRASEMILAMGLGDKNLLDLLRDYEAKGQKGIPVNELLDYMEGAGRAIDFLNSPRHDLGSGPVAIQHGDIKPQNILIVGDAAQVCDFGLARALGSGRATRATAASFTTAYAAPELLTENKPGRFTDQYALAISYIELRTGELPFNTNFPAAILYAHTQGKLDLSKLSPPEQAILRRATAIKPEERFPLCLDMIKELRRVLQGGAAAVASAATTTALVKYGGMPSEGKEIVPGYVLVKALGKGSFGEVWEAKAPGGKHVAIKIIRNLEAPSGKQEFKALEMIKGVDHNHLMELHAYWLIDDKGQIISDAQREGANPPKAVTLVIACKLAKKHLGQRLRECLEETGRGIPLPELLFYLDQAAEAIDFLNTPQHHLGDKVVAIQHRDIKPENILLADGTVKVADFGLAKVLEDTAAIVHAESAGLTLAYAAPELFRGRVTQWTDQYALAITYFQLRTGVLPFQATGTANDIVRIHLDGRLDFSRAPGPEAAVLRKATSVIPEERFPSCRDFCAALVEACADSPEFSAVGGVSGVLRYGGSSQRLRQTPGSGPSSGRIVTPSARTTPQGPGTVPELNADEVTLQAGQQPGLSRPGRTVPIGDQRTTPNVSMEATVPGAPPGQRTPSVPMSRKHGPPPQEVQSLMLAGDGPTPSTIRRRRWQHSQKELAGSEGGGASGMKLAVVLFLLIAAAAGVAGVFVLKPEWIKGLTGGGGTLPTATATATTSATGGDTVLAGLVEQQRWTDAAAALPELPPEAKAKWTEQVQQGWLKQANAAFAAKEYAKVEQICAELLKAFPDYGPATQLQADVAKRLEEEKQEEARRLAALKLPAVLESTQEVNKETNWPTVLAACEAALKHPKLAEFQTRLAVIRLEASVEQHQGRYSAQAKAELGKQLAALPPESAADPFGHYVVALVQSALGAADKATEHLLAVPSTAWKAQGSYLDCPYRRERAAQVLDQALTARFPLPRPLEKPFDSPADAEQAAAALRLHSELAPGAAPPLPRRVLGVLAAFSRPKPDVPAARQAAERLLDDPALRAPTAWHDRLAVLLALARTQGDSPEEVARAAELFRAAWSQLPDNHDLSAIDRYKFILAPALELANRTQPDRLNEVARRDLGWLCAQLGELLDNNLYGVDWPFPDTRQQAVDAFTAALKFDAENAQWYVGRARARHYLREKKSPQERRQVLQGIEADALRAKELKPDLPGGHHWLGYVRILQARDTLELGERIRLAQQAIEHFERARPLYDQPGYDAGARAQLFTSMSATYLDLANHWQATDPGAKRAKQKELLEQALLWAERATENNPLYPEKAWLAVAHATEDFGLLLGELPAYDRAIEAFGKVIELRGDEAEGFLGQGRARYRSQVALPPGKADYSQAESRLEQARRFAKGTFGEAEALHWLGLVSARRGDWSKAREQLEASLQLAQRFERQGWQVKNLQELVELVLDQAAALPPESSEDAALYSQARQWQDEVAKLAPALGGPLRLRIMLAEAARLSRSGEALNRAKKTEQARTVVDRLEQLGEEMSRAGERIQGAFWRARALRHRERLGEAIKELDSVLADFQSPEESVAMTLLQIERLFLYMKLPEKDRPKDERWLRHLDEARATFVVAAKRGELQPAELVWCHSILGTTYWGLCQRVAEAEQAAFIDTGINELRQALTLETDDTPLMQSRLVDLLWLKVNGKAFDEGRRADERKELCDEAIELLGKLRKHPAMRSRAKQFEELADKFKQRRNGP